MAIGPIGNTIYVNQQIPYIASLQADHTQRIDFQNMVANKLANEKEKEIQEVRPTEENQKVDPDKEHQQDQPQKDSKEKKNETKKENKEDVKSNLHKLDIKV